jgi:hypothetical protein
VSEATLPPLPASSARQPPPPSSEWLVAARRARALSWLSLVWMGAEGAIAITAGILAGSIALIGFGIDSAIEGFASLVIVWRSPGTGSSPTPRRSAPRSWWRFSSSCSRPTSC